MAMFFDISHWLSLSEVKKRTNRIPRIPYVIIHYPSIGTKDGCYPGGRCHLLAAEQSFRVAQSPLEKFIRGAEAEAEMGKA